MSKKRMVMKHMFLFLMFTVVSFGQTKGIYTSIDKKMDAIPDSFTKSTDSIALYVNTNFKTENDKIRAIFYWTASNISYDEENMFVVNYNETREDRTAKTLKTKKGICNDYADVFNKIANASGIKAIVISGYTKTNEMVDDLSHSWCAAKIENKWYVFDPTWGRSYLKSENKNYIRNTTNSYFKIAPEIMIHSHMPFDYLWQFMDYPLTNQEFIDGVIAADASKVKFDFIKEIARYEALSKANQFFESSERIKKNGMKNQFVSQAYVNAMNQWNYEKDKENRDKFNENLSKVNAISKRYKEAFKRLNDFGNYRNRKFQPSFSDEVIKKSIQELRDELAKCKVDICDVEFIGDQNKANLDNLDNNISKSLAKAEEHLQFVTLYLTKPKSVRETMFYTVARSSKPN